MSKNLKTHLDESDGTETSDTYPNIEDPQIAEGVLKFGETDSSRPLYVLVDPCLPATLTKKLLNSSREPDKRTPLSLQETHYLRLLESAAQILILVDNDELADLVRNDSLTAFRNIKGALIIGGEPFKGVADGAETIRNAFPASEYIFGGNGLNLKEIPPRKDKTPEVDGPLGDILGVVAKINGKIARTLVSSIVEDHRTAAAYFPYFELRREERAAILRVLRSLGIGVVGLSQKKTARV